MLDKSKTNPELGKKVNDYLKEKGVHTPTEMHNNMDNKEKKEYIESLYNNIMEALNQDLNDDSLKDTPRRVAKMYVDELFWGMDSNNFPKCTAVENKMKYDEMVVEKNIKVASVCEHHIQPIWGKCHIAYIPDKKVIGLSKMNRIVEYFCRRPQIQERLTEQIYYALSYILETPNVAVVIDAEHFCVKLRGVEDINSSTVTSKLGKKFIEEPELRAEFMGLIK